MRIRSIKPEFWNTAQQPWEHGCSVYVVQERRNGPIKAGIASHLLQRLSSLQCGNPRKLSLKAVFCGARSDCHSIEKHVLTSLSKFLVLGEWLSCGITLATDEISKFEVAS